MRKITPRIYAQIILLIIVAMVVIFAGSSCNVTKHTNKSKTTDERVNDLVAAFSATVTERIDTTITINSATITAINDIDKVLSGDTLREDTPDLSVISFFDKHTKRLHTTAVRKAVVIPVEKIKQSVSNGSLSVHGSTKTVVDSKVSDTQRTGGFHWDYLWLIIGVLSVGFFIVIGIKKEWFKEKPTV